MNKFSVLGASALLMLGLGGGSYALWDDNSTTTKAVVQSGDLDIKLVGNTTWKDSNDETIDPSNYIASAGDTFTIEQKFSSKLEGDNVLGKLSTQWIKPEALNTATATYSIVDPDGKTVVDEQNLGTPSEIKDMQAGDEEYTFKINLNMPADFQNSWVSLPTNSDPASRVDVGDIKLNLDQVRSGSGYK